MHPCKESKLISTEICTSNCMPLSAINDKFDKWQLRGIKFIINCTRNYAITG